VHLGAGGDNVAQQGFGAFDVDGEIIVDEEDGNLAASLLARAFKRSSSFTRFRSCERMESPKKPVTVQKLAPIRTSGRLHGNDANVPQPSLMR